MSKLWSASFWRGGGNGRIRDLPGDSGPRGLARGKKDLAVAGPQTIRCAGTQDPGSRGRHCRPGAAGALASALAEGAQLGGVAGLAAPCDERTQEEVVIERSRPASMKSKLDRKGIRRCDAAIDVIRN